MSKRVIGQPLGKLMDISEKSNHRVERIVWQDACNCIITVTINAMLNEFIRMRILGNIEHIEILYSLLLLHSRKKVFFLRER